MVLKLNSLHEVKHKTSVSTLESVLFNEGSISINQIYVCASNEADVTSVALDMTGGNYTDAEGTGQTFEMISCDSMSKTLRPLSRLISPCPNTQTGFPTPTARISPMRGTHHVRFPILHYWPTHWPYSSQYTQTSIFPFSVGFIGGRSLTGPPDT